MMTMMSEICQVFLAIIKCQISDPLSSLSQEIWYRSFIIVFRRFNLFFNYDIDIKLWNVSISI